MEFLGATAVRIVIEPLFEASFRSNVEAVACDSFKAIRDALEGFRVRHSGLPLKAGFCEIPC